VKSCISEFDRRGVSVVVVSFAEPAKLRPYQEHYNWPFPVLADPDRTVYRTFNLKRLSWLRVFSPSTLGLYFKLLRAGMRPENYGKDDLYQAGGDFLLDRQGSILFAHRSRDPSDRPATAKLLDEIDRLREKLLAETPFDRDRSSP
jgi:peroxiredoxin